MENIINVAFIGNPNCGKTTLFNAYTGAGLKVANWPGVTIEKKEGDFEFDGQKMKLVDLPGIYSLTSYTMEERLSREYILQNDVDVIIDVADASSLERNLYLTVQLIEIGKPVILALNMMDIVKARGMSINTKKLSQMLGIPVIPISARKRTGLDELMRCAYSTAKAGKGNNAGLYGNYDIAVKYDRNTKAATESVAAMIKEKYPDTLNTGWIAVKILERDDEICGKYNIDTDVMSGNGIETEIINQRYGLIEKIITEVLVNKDKKSHMTDKIDSVLIHPILGIPVFMVVMAFVFFLTFTVGDFLRAYFESVFEYISDTVADFLLNMNVNETVRSLAVDGIIAGVDAVLTFLPNIFILFLALAFLEDSGYMARVAYIMDSFMSKLGLSGKAFIPMILGFGCSVPAVMATRTLENRSDKIKTILAVPFMSCSARLPIYVLLSETFFARNAMLAAYSMYIVGIAMSVAVAKFVNVGGKNNRRSQLLIELPEYKLPDAHTVFIYVWEKLKDYITKAGTTIFVASVVLWLLLNFGPHGITPYIEQSYAAYIGKFIAPLLAPAGLGYWQIAVALISGIAAKEVVVSSLGVLFGIGNILSAEGMCSLADSLSALGFTSVNAYSMMLFCLLYVPCMATVATIKKETVSLGYTWLSVCIHIISAWSISTLFFCCARLIAGFF